MIKRFKDFINTKKAKVFAVAMSVVCIMAMAIPASAEEAFPITSDMLNGVTSNFNSAITVAAPVGISVMCIILGVKFVPKLIKALAK